MSKKATALFGNVSGDEMRAFGIGMWNEAIKAAAKCDPFVEAPQYNEAIAIDRMRAEIRKLARNPKPEGK